MPTERTIPELRIGARSFTCVRGTVGPLAVAALERRPSSRMLRTSGASGRRSTISSPARRPGRAWSSIWNVTSFISGGLQIGCPELARQAQAELAQRLRGGMGGLGELVVMADERHGGGSFAVPLQHRRGHRGE